MNRPFNLDDDDVTAEEIPVNDGLDNDGRSDPLLDDQADEGWEDDGGIDDPDLAAARAAYDHDEESLGTDSLRLDRPFSTD